MKNLMFVCATVAMCVISGLGVTAAEKSTKVKSRPTVHQTASTNQNPITTDLPAGEIPIPPATPIPPGLATQTVVVDTHGNRLTGTTAGIPSGKLVYSNNLGRSAFGIGGASFNARLADDLATIAEPGCTLDSYVIRVTGDRGFDGLGQGDYTVTTALHEICPGAQPDPIPGTQVDTTIRIGIDVATEAEIAEIVVKMPLGVNIDISDVHYISVRFSRDHCGVVVGAPASVGFSGDRFDFPGSPCIAHLGTQGFPGSPHASFGADLYVREDACPTSHVAYRNINNNGGFRTEGAGVYFAQSVQIGVPLCNLIGWEIAYKGNGAVQADLRRALSATDPNFGFVIPGSREFFISSNASGIQIGRHIMTQPVPLSNSRLFMVFRTTSSRAGPLLTCSPPVLGDSVNGVFVFDQVQGEWVLVPGAGNCVLNLDITLFCENLPPIGACCDLILPDDQNEAVCRDGVPEMNCAFPPLWQEGDLCAGICVGGSNDGAACTRQADCLGGDCDGPFFDPCGIAACCKPLDANPGGCENLTFNQCNAIEPIANPRLFDRGKSCARGGQRCPTPACIGREGDCFAPRDGICVNGLDDGQPCDPFGVPVPCQSFACSGGTNDGMSCVLGGNNCPDGGVCERGLCMGAPGCENPFCCSTVCDSDPVCCNIHWDFNCANAAAQICQDQPKNDECAPGPRQDGARLIQIPTTVDANCLTATSSDTDPGFCCHTGISDDPSVGPGSQAENTVWFRFVAPTDSVSLTTCCTPGTRLGEGKDSLLQVFEVSDSDRGICTDFSPCSVAAQDCADGSTCVLDQVAACASLNPIGCNDDEPTCACGLSPEPTRSKLCVKGLVPGNMYYVLVGAKSNREELRCSTIPHNVCSPIGTICNPTGDPMTEGRCEGTGVFPDRGIYELTIGTSCSADPHLSNDFCLDAEIPAGESDPNNYPLAVPFDLSGASSNEAPATFDCPGPPPSINIVTLQNDIWYDWTAPCNGTVTIDTCDGTATPDTGMVVYRGCDCPVSLATGDIVAWNDFAPPETPVPCFLGSYVKFDVEAGQCYKVRLGGDLGGTPAGTLNFDLTCSSCPESVTFDDPPAGTVDARQPHPPGDASTLQGIDSFTISGDASGATFGANGCWSLCDSDPASSNDISSITDNGDGTYTIHLLRPITPDQVTTLTYNGDSGTPTVGIFTSHPGNANGDNVASAADVMAMIDFLTDPVGAALPWDAYSGDADHSGTIAAPDILRVVDLLNGAGTFTGWMGTPLPDCGSCCPPP